MEIISSSTGLFLLSQLRLDVLGSGPSEGLWKRDNLHPQLGLGSRSHIVALGLPQIFCRLIAESA